MSLLYEWIDPNDIYTLRHYNPATKRTIRIQKKGLDLNYFEAEFVLNLLGDISPHRRIILDNHFKIYQN